MLESTERMHITRAAGEPSASVPYVSVLERARDEVGALTYYLEQTLQKLREVNQHLEGSARDVPSVLHDLREIVRMTEAGTVTVLEETEALMDEGQAAGRLVAEIQKCLRQGQVADGETRLDELQALIRSGDTRITTIMSALQFQDLTSQKIQGAFDVLEEVMVRLARIRTLLDAGREAPAATAGQNGSPHRQPSEQKSGQALADELLRGFVG